MASPKRRVFFSFHYEKDAWRAAKIRNAGTLEGNEPVTDNNWKTIKRGGESAIQRWIDQQISTRSCTVVLIGRDTARRKWVEYEIVKSWNSGKGVVGIYIHNLKDRFGYPTAQGANPFDVLRFNGTRQAMSAVVKTYNPPYWNSQAVYQYITNNIAAWVENAIRQRNPR